jgi:cytochrome c oxidase cbb3-type subunit 3
MADHSHAHDVETDHEYDGIREFDNPLPNWWLATLWLAVIFGGLYWIWFQQLPADGSMGAYHKAMNAHEELMLANSISDEELAAAMTDPAAIAAGQEIYDVNCKSCHGAKGEGLVGPNLTDGYWLHGAAPKDIYITVARGVQNPRPTAMAPWLPVLGGDKLSHVVAYVNSLKGSNVPGPRGPEGKPVP